MAITSQRFGSQHTVTKLEKVEEYLRLFVKVMKNRAFDTIYMDACAGSGASLPVSIANQSALFESDEIVRGSANRALNVDPHFSRYIFNDLDPSNVESLKQLARQHPHISNRITVTEGDASAAVTNLCQSTNWKRSRAVVFLDPFGLSPIKFPMLEQLAQTKAVDLWFLVPVGGMNRQVSSSGQFQEPGAKLIDEMLGTDEWRQDAVASEQTSDLFENTTKTKKLWRAPHFEQVAIKQLRRIFLGGVSEKALPLGRNGSHEFSLVFACANPEPAAFGLALRLANGVLK